MVFFVKCIYMLKPEQKRWNFADNICKCIFFNENNNTLVLISLKFVPKGPVDKKSSLV